MYFKNFILLFFFISLNVFCQVKKNNSIRTNQKKVSSLSGPIAYFKLNNNNRNETNSGHSLIYNGEYQRYFPKRFGLVPETVLRFENEQENYSSYFFGSESIIINSPNKDVSKSKNYSISFWLMPSFDDISRYDIFSLSQTKLQLYYINKQLIIEILNENNEVKKLSLNIDFPYGKPQWHFINMLIENKKSLSLYIDDKKVSFDVKGIELNFSDTIIFGNKSNLFAGIDEIKLYDRLLTKNEIDNYYYKIKKLSKESQIISEEMSKSSVNNSNYWKFEITDWESKGGQLQGTRTEIAYLKIYKNNQIYSTPGMYFTITDNDDSGLIIAATCNGFNSGNKYISDNALDSTINSIIRDYIKSIDKNAKF